MDISIREWGLRVQTGSVSQGVSYRSVFKAKFVFKLVRKFLRFICSKGGNEIHFYPSEKSQNAVLIITAKKLLFPRSLL